MSELRVKPELILKLARMVAQNSVDVDELHEVVDDIARANNLNDTSTLLLVNTFEQAIT